MPSAIAKKKRGPKRTSDRRASSRVANKARARADQTVTIPRLTAAQRRKRERLEADAEAWIWEMCGPKSGIVEPLSYKFTSQQTDMIHDYENALMYGGDEMTLASRGEGKTTYFRICVLRSIARGAVAFVALVAATGEDSTNSREAIASVVTESEPFRKLYPEIAIPVRGLGASPQAANSMRATGTRYDNGEKFEGELISFKWSQQGFWFPNVPGSPSARAIMQFRGADKAIRGLNILGRRPEIVAIDDLDTPDTVGNPDVAKKVIDRVDLDIGGLKGQSGRFARLMLATLPKQACGVAHHYATQGHPFVVKRHQYLIDKPTRWDMWMEYVKRRQRAKLPPSSDSHARDAHRFYLKNRDDMEAGAQVSNPHRFNSTRLPDGTKTQESALQNYFDEWADKGEYFCRCELDNELIEIEATIQSKFQDAHVTRCEGKSSRGVVENDTSMIVRAIDVRKTELHHFTLASDGDRSHRIPDYDVRSHGTSETTVEEAEHLIGHGLVELEELWLAEPLVDRNGEPRDADLTLIDKGWLGNWKEDGETKTWATQPVETFCMSRTLRRWLPAKGQPRYRSPKPADDVIIGDHWHMNRGTGAERSCTELIWDAEYWHSLVEGLFMAIDEFQRFELFHGASGLHVGHKRLAEHIREGSEDLADLKRRGSATRKQRYRRDHWWDGAAMALVAQSVEQWFRTHFDKQRNKAQQIARQRRAALARSSNAATEIGAR